jgi:hypothetical protein
MVISSCKLSVIYHIILLRKKQQKQILSRGFSSRIPAVGGKGEEFRTRLPAGGSMGFRTKTDREILCTFPGILYCEDRISWYNILENMCCGTKNRRLPHAVPWY